MPYLSTLVCIFWKCYFTCRAEKKSSSCGGEPIMNKVRTYAILATLLVSFLLLGTYGQAATYYIAGNGSDSNNGTSKSTPWLHAPGMTGCSGNCASKTPQPGDQFVLRGGDTWHFSGRGGTPVGLTWTWTWSGTSGSRIYIGVDKTWYSGGSWIPPKMNGDNPLNKTAVTSCTYPSGSNDYVFIGGNYVTFDNFEFLGLCWEGSESPYYLVVGSSTTYVTVQNMYFHGWTHTPSAGAGAYAINGASNNDGGEGTEFAFNSIDGSDSDGTVFTGLYGNCYNFHDNIVRYNSNGVICNNMHRFHNNLIEYIYNSSISGVHSNGFEFNSEWRTGSSPNLVYNNVIRHIYTPVTCWVNPQTTIASYYFNNLVYDVQTQVWDVDSSAGGSAAGAYWINNTFVGGTDHVPITTGGQLANTYVYNNHCINGYGGCISGTTYTGSNNLVQTPAQATATGYASSNFYQPTSTTSPTVDTGINRTSYCTNASAICSDTTLAGTRTPNARPSIGAWDIGAYDYSSSSNTPPAGPVGVKILP
jgi:hypothetical protein